MRREKEMIIEYDFIVNVEIQSKTKEEQKDFRRKRR